MEKGERREEGRERKWRRGGERVERVWTLSLFPSVLLVDAVGLGWKSSTTRALLVRFGVRLVPRHYHV